MSRVSRRSFLAGSAAFVAAPALAAGPDAADVDAVVVGAGAAGIAAARRLIAARKSVAIFEAAGRVGGRCVTDGAFFGMPFDLGAHWIHNPDANALLAQAAKSGLDIYPAPRGQTLRVGRRNARDAEMEAFLGGLLRAHRALLDTGKFKTDAAAARLLPADLGDWRASVEFVLGSYALGKSLADVSALDLARAVERDSESFCRQGYGALLAPLAAGLPVRLSAPVGKIDWSKSAPLLSTARGDIRARAVIVTVSTNMLTADRIVFNPPLPKRQLDAAAKLALGSFDHVALEMPGNPLGLQGDDLLFEQANGPGSAALLANVSGTDLHLVEVAGAFGRELSAKGEAAMVDFAGEWLASLFGANAKRAIKRSRATRWNADPWTLGAMSAAAPGAADARHALMESVGGRIWFAGEAAHDTQWGTVNGAWESGERAADAVLRRIGTGREEDRPARRPERARNKRRR